MTKTLNEKYGETTGATNEETLALLKAASTAAFEAGDTFAVNRFEYLAHVERNAPLWVDADGNEHYA